MGFLKSPKHGIKEQTATSDIYLGAPFRLSQLLSQFFFAVSRDLIPSTCCKVIPSFLPSTTSSERGALPFCRLWRLFKCMARSNVPRDEMLHNVSLETGRDFRAQKLKLSVLGGFVLPCQKARFPGQAVPKLFEPTAFMAIAMMASRILIMQVRECLYLRKIFSRNWSFVLVMLRRLAHLVG